MEEKIMGFLTFVKESPSRGIENGIARWASMVDQQEGEVPAPIVFGLFFS